MKGSVSLERERLGFQWDVDFLLKEKSYALFMYIEIGAVLKEGLA